MHNKTDFELINGIFKEYWNGTVFHKTYNPERYELVEKKDWKIKQLKNNIKYKKELIENYKKELKFYEELLVVNMEALEKLEKELKELE